MKVSKHDPLRKLKVKAWNVFSLYIRSKRDVDKTGRSVCFTCGAKKPYKEMQAGHFVHGCLDYDEHNIHSQCARCNRYLHGNWVPYSLKILKLYGTQEHERLLRAKFKVERYTTAGLEAIIGKYKV